MDHALPIATGEQLVIAEQARKVRALYPELFAALNERDRLIRRALDRIPNPADPESLVPHPVIEHALLTLRQLDRGIHELCDADC